MLPRSQWLQITTWRRQLTQLKRRASVSIGNPCRRNLDLNPVESDTPYRTVYHTVVGTVPVVTVVG